jgi:translation initiation factor IF-2
MTAISAGVTINTYKVIYNLIDDVTAAMHHLILPDLHSFALHMCYMTVTFAGVTIHTYKVIYNLIDEVKAAMHHLLNCQTFSHLRYICVT